jgi:lysylphosphatidylglycerol synthetase-like protein (DUF2156 family)
LTAIFIKYAGLKMTNKKILHKLRLITGAALVGCVISGVLLNPLHLGFDPHIVGASLAALIASIKLQVFA